MLGACLTEKELPGKNKDSCMFIILPINSLSTETLESGLLWIGLAAIWTWTVVARSLPYQTSRCQSLCPGWADERRRKRQLLCWGAYTQGNRNSPHSRFCSFPAWHRWLKPSRGPRLWVLWQVLWVWYPCVVAASEVVAGRQSYFELYGAQLKVEQLRRVLVVHNQLRSRQFSFPRAATGCETCIKPPGISFLMQLPWPQPSNAVW